MGNIKIFVDTAADMREDIAKEKNIGIIRFLSVFGEETYVTGTELTNEEFYKKLDEFGSIPKTAQTPYADNRSSDPHGGKYPDPFPVDYVAKFEYNERNLQQTGCTYATAGITA